MKSAKSYEVWRKTLVSMFLVVAILVFLVAPAFESRGLVQVITMAVFSAFWVGALWAHCLVTHKMQESLSHPLPLIDENGNLHPLMKIGAFYRVLACLASHREAGEQLYVLRATSGGEDGKILLAWAERTDLPTTFQVVKKTEERGARMRTTKFVFE